MCVHTRAISYYYNVYYIDAEAVNNLKDFIFNYHNTVTRRTLRNGLVMSKWVQE